MYKGNTSQNKSAYASIYLHSHSLDINFWNNYFDITPDRAFGKGDRRIFPNGKIGDVNTRVGVWSFSAKLLVNSDQLDPYVTFLIAKFGLPRSDLPDLLARMNTTMRCLCFWSNYSGDRIAKVSPHLQDILAKSGIVLEIDEYPGTNNGQPWPDVVDGNFIS